MYDDEQDPDRDYDARQEDRAYDEYKQRLLNQPQLVIPKPRWQVQDELADKFRDYIRTEFEYATLPSRWDKLAVDTAKIALEVLA